MSLEGCISATASELGIDKSDAQEIADRLVAERGKAGPEGATERLRAFAKGKAEEAKIAAALKRKQAALNVLVRDRADKFIDARVATGQTPAKAIAELLVGSVYTKEGVSQRRVALEGAWLNEMLGEAHAKAPVAFDMIRRKPAEARPFFDAVVREMHELREGGSPGKTGNKDAQALARIFAGYGEASRLTANKAGANIGKLDGWAGPQRYDDAKMLRLGEARFVDRVFTELDRARSFGEGATDEEIRQSLRRSFRTIVTGRDAIATPAERGERLGPSNIANSLGEHRVWHFKDADAWLRVNDEFGKGHITDGMIDHLRKTARKVSLMEKLGPNPEVMLRSIMEARAREIEEGIAPGDPRLAAKEIGKLKLTTGFFGGSEIGKAWAVVSGATNVPSDVSVSRFFAYTRAVLSMAKLGGMLASQFSDLATYGAAMHDQGRGIFQGQADAVRGLLAGGGEAAERRGMLLGVAGDSMLGDFHALFDDQGGLPGKIGAMHEAFYKWTGARWWQDRLETAISNMTSANLAAEAKHGWAGVNPAIKRLLGLYGIGADRWEVMRKAVVKADDGRSYLMPGEIGGLGDEHFGHVAPERIDRERHDLEMAARAYLAEESRHGMLKGDDRTRMVATQGVPPGSALGEVIRMVMQFKTFTAAYTQGPLARQFLGKADQGAPFLRRLGQGTARNVPAIASLVAFSTVYGYLSMTVKDALKNRSPKDPRKPATILAALVQGGGAGLYGDYLFGQYDRFGGGVASSLPGPAIGEAARLVDLVQKARQGAADYAETGKQSDVGKADFINFALSNAPFVNLHFVRAALDLAILNTLQEWASPGTFKRREATVLKQFGQHYIVPPLALGGGH
jgi:hypothetical protein